MDDRLMETDVCQSSTPISSALPTLAGEVSCKRKCSSPVNLVKKLKSEEDGSDNGQEAVKDDTADKKLEKTRGGWEAHDTRDDPLLQERKVIKMKGTLPQLALPDGWIALNHRSGGIIYLHRPTRVCTWSRPYQIGIGSVRKHDVPLAAVPCLHHKKALEKEQESKNNGQATTGTDSNQGITLLNLLNAPEALNHGKAVSNSSGPSVSSQRENLVNTTETNEASSQVLKNGSNFTQGTEQASVPLLFGHSQETSDDDSALDSRLAGKEGHSAQGDASSFHGLQSGLDVVVGIDDMTDTLGTHCTPCDARSSNVELISPVDVSQGGSLLSRTSSKEGDLHSGKAVSSSEKSLSSIQFQNHGLSKEAILNGVKAISGSANQENGSVLGTGGQSLVSNGIDLVDAGELESYLSNLWEFQNLTQEQERNALVMQPDAQDETEIELPASLECLPYSVKGVEVGKQARDILVESHNKTPVALLHEHCQRTLKTKPVYVTSECDNPNSPFMAEVQIEGMKYGSGTGTNKKHARQEAAEATLEILMPEIFRKKRDYIISQDELEFFDKLDITDKQLFNLCTRVNIPTPSQVLQECLKRNHGICPSTINFRIIPEQNQNHTYKITCGKHTATGPCKNKKIGKQLASQAILQKLHPHLTKWGSLLRIYCDRPSAVVKKYKKEKDEMCSSDHPNDERLLLKLKQEMMKLAQGRNSACVSGSSSSESSLPSVFTVEM